MEKNQGFIKEIEETQIQEAALFAWKVYQDESKRTTPPYHDLQDMVAQFEKKVKSVYQRLLAYTEDQQLKGVFSVDVNDAEKYIGTTGGPYIEDIERYDEIADAFMGYLEQHCKGYVCYFGTTKPNVRSQMYLESKGFVCTEDTVQTRIVLENLMSEATQIVTHNGESNQVELLKEEDYALYSQFHKTHFPDYYWTADKIFEVIDKWRIHVVKREGKIIGCVFTMKQTDISGEVYGATVLPEYEKTLMLDQLYYASAQAWFECGVLEIVNFIPEGYMLDAAIRVGYQPYDTYMCYYKECLMG